jgi:hypothetical protein
MFRGETLTILVASPRDILCKFPSFADGRPTRMFSTRIPTIARWLFIETAARVWETGKFVT